MQYRIIVQQMRETKTRDPEQENKKNSVTITIEQE
jgi:hypothetical protein